VEIITVVSGEGTLVAGGGTMVDGKTTAPHEIRGKSIDGGVRKPMAAGDVFYIPANIPHQMLVPKSMIIQVVKWRRNSAPSANPSLRLAKVSAPRPLFR